MIELFSARLKAQQVKYEAEIQRLKQEVDLYKQKATFFENLFVTERQRLQKVILQTKLTKQ